MEIEEHIIFESPVHDVCGLSFVHTEMNHSYQDDIRGYLR